MNNLKKRLILFPSKENDPSKVDSVFSSDMSTAVVKGYLVALFSYQEIIHGKVRLNFLGGCPKETIKEKCRENPALYRGWILPGDSYRLLYSAVRHYGFSLVNNPEEYLNGQYIPRYHPIIAEYTQAATWFSDPEVDTTTVSDFLSKRSYPVMMKDYVKSEPQEEFTNIRPDVTASELARLCRNFSKERFPLFEGGFVLREKVPLKKYYHVTKSPVSNEWRFFCFRTRDHTAVLAPESRTGLTWTPEPTKYFQVIMKINHIMKSNYYSVDVAETEDGEWTVIEIGDGQVSETSRFEQHLKCIF